MNRRKILHLMGIMACILGCVTAEIHADTPLRIGQFNYPYSYFVQGNSGVNPGFGLTYGFARFEREFNMALWLTSRPFRGVIVNRWAESRPDVSRRI